MSMAAAHSLHVSEIYTHLNIMHEFLLIILEKHFANKIDSLGSKHYISLYIFILIGRKY